MKNLKILICSIILLPLFYSCDFISNTFTYKKITKEFVNSIIDEDYDKSINYFDDSFLVEANNNRDSVKVLLTNFREYFVDRFGTKIEYSFIKAEKRRSTIESQNTPPGTTEVFLQINNDQYFGIIQFLFDDNSGKILRADILNMKERIPSVSLFILAGVIAMIVPIFNIYMLVRVYRSSLKKKWMKYLAIILLNLPALTYTMQGSLYFELLKIQALFGISFSLSGYASSFWAVGIPLGGIYWYWRLSERKRLEKDGIDLDNKINPTEGA
ncbi:MAG: hypothetical protein QM653_05215 [Dysgonomonas sp.]|uniref:hypothetical protein n=1 Tax=Dysgonomonas sp. TaxID=1891233 RepID=UPI0039E4CEE2